MWKIIDEQMSLKECSVYCYSPEEDPYEGEDGAIWSLNYFFFNKARKRVCYVYLRGISILSRTTMDGTATPLPSKRSVDDDDDYSSDEGARKRARFWLGDQADVEIQDNTSDEEEEPPQEKPKPARPVVDEYDNYLLSDEDVRSRSASGSVVRAMSEEIADAMEV